MKTSHLHDIWAGPDNSRLVSKQFSFRLPVHLAAKLEALNELYAQKNRTQIVSDLLTAALDDFEKNLPQTLDPISKSDQNHFDLDAIQMGHQPQPLFYIRGVRGRFRELTNKYYKQLENELGNENPTVIYTNEIVSEVYLESQK